MVTLRGIESIFPKEHMIPVEWQLPRPTERNEYLIGGKILRWSGRTCEVISPLWTFSESGAMPRVIGTIPLLGKHESLAALDAAVTAYGRGTGLWPRMPIKHRISCVEKFVSFLKKKKKEIVTLLMWEIGKPLSESYKEFERTIEYLKDSIKSAQKEGYFEPKTLSTQSVWARMRFAPLGVVFCLSSYNFPLNEMLSMVIPALLMGNTVIIKPPRFGVLLYFLLLEAFLDFFPAGVVNVIWGDAEISDPIMASGSIDALAFVGSSQAAYHLARLHPQPYRLRYCMGLEAKNPAVVLPDADIDNAVVQSVDGALRFNGQRCTALKILFVHENMLEPFLEKLVNAVDNLSFGMPWERGVFLTPIPDVDRISYLKDLIVDAVAQGAQVLNSMGGTNNGSFISPSVVYPIKNTMRLYKEEQFGPIIPIASFNDLDEILSYLSNSDYSQQVSIFSGQELPDNVLRILENQVCRININSACQRGPDYLPFAARKNSGVGVRSVVDTLEAFCVPALVTGLTANRRLLVSGKGVTKKAHIFP